MAAENKYNFGELEVGKEKRFEFEKKSVAVRCRTAAHAFGQTTDRKFKTKVVDDKDLIVRRVK